MARRMNGRRVVDVAHHLGLKGRRDASDALQSPSRSVYRVNQGVLNRSWTYRYASSATCHMDCCGTAMPKGGRRLLEQQARRRLVTNEQTGRRSGDGDWSKCSNARKRHCVCLSLGEAEERGWRGDMAASSLPYGGQGACRGRALIVGSAPWRW